LNGKNTAFSAILGGDPVGFKLFKFADIVCYGGIDEVIQIPGAGDNRIENKKDARSAIRNNFKVFQMSQFVMSKFMGGKKGNEILMDAIVNKGCCEVNRFPVTHGIGVCAIDNINGKGTYSLNLHAGLDPLDYRHDFIHMDGALDNGEFGASTPHNQNNYEA
jgi:hypothetical protein